MVKQKAAELAKADININWDDVPFGDKDELRQKIEVEIKKPVRLDVIDWRIGRALAYEREKAKSKGQSS